jgi:hypothetical protein
MPRYAANVADDLAPVPFGGETEPAAHRRPRSSLEFVIDDDASAAFGPRDETMSGERPHVAQYLFNSMPCAYAWFHH